MGKLVAVTVLLKEAKKEVKKRISAIGLEPANLCTDGMRRHVACRSHDSLQRFQNKVRIWKLLRLASSLHVAAQVKDRICQDSNSALLEDQVKTS